MVSKCMNMSRVKDYQPTIRIFLKQHGFIMFHPFIFITNTSREILALNQINPEEKGGNMKFIGNICGSNEICTKLEQ